MYVCKYIYLLTTANLSCDLHKQGGTAFTPPRVTYRCIFIYVCVCIYIYMCMYVCM